LKLVELGRIVKPHGVRGEVKIRLHWAESETLTKMRSVLLVRESGALETWRVESVRGGPKGVLLKLEGIDDRDAAETLRDAAVNVERTALPELEPGEYYLCDLVGAEVVGPAGPVGRIVEVRTHPTVDTLVIETPRGGRVEQAIAEPWIEEVDPERGLVRLATTEGLM
jgi:16S rRNA processing protein RimM